MNNFWLTLPKPFFVLAPMEGVTNNVLREAMVKLGKPDVLFTEFTNVAALASEGREKTLARLKFSPKQRPIVAQLWGSEPNFFFLAAKMVRKLGFNGVDLNFGCPDKGVVGQDGGAGLMRQPYLAEEIIKATRRGCGLLPLSVKTRLGFDAVLPEWIKFILSQPIEALTIHGRTVRQKFSGEADWEEIKKVVQLRNKVNPDMIIIGNGDVAGYQNGLLKSQRYSVDGLMIGRRLLTDPWVFEKKKGVHPPRERLAALLRHVDLHCRLDGDSNFAELKKFFKMYASGFGEAKKLRQKLMACHCRNEIKEVIKSSGL